VTRRKDRQTNNGELNRHQGSQEIKQDLENRPTLSLPKPPRARKENKGVPCCNSEGADEKVLVSGEMRGEVERGGELRCGHDKEGTVGGREGNQYEWDIKAVR
jgi:hypothetical protein